MEIVKNIFNGRIGRFNFFLSWLLLIVGFILVSIFVGDYSPEYNYYTQFNQINFSYLSAILLLFLQIAYIIWWIILISLIVRRLHDLGYGGLYLILLVPFSIIPIVFIFLNFLRGNNIENKYGLSESKKWSLNLLLNRG